MSFRYVVHAIAVACFLAVALPALSPWHRGLGGFFLTIAIISMRPSEHLK